MTRLPVIAVMFGVACAASAPAAYAQAPGAGPGRIEASIGALWIGHQVLGSAVATETTPTGGSVNTFATATELSSVLGAEGRIAIRLLSSLEAEVEGSYGAPKLEVAISGDSEGGSNVTAVDQVQQFTIGGGVVWYLRRPSGSRLVPFVTGGVGQLRQMHEDRIELETGLYLQVGGGAKYFFFSRPDGMVNAFGARVDVRALVRSGGVSFEDHAHVSPALGASAFVRF